jgi:hypothetical protein
MKAARDKDEKLSLVSGEQAAGSDRQTNYLKMKLNN